MNFEECWEKAITEIEAHAQEKERAASVCRYTRKDGSIVRINLSHIGDDAFISAYTMRKALGVSVLAQNILKSGIDMKKIESKGVGHGRYVLDAENAVRFIVRYGDNEPDFKDFFRDNIFPRLASFA